MLRTLLFFLIALAAPASATPIDFTAPRGHFAELHSCEVFAGPCVVNSELNQPGNYLLRVWQFDSGTIGGVPLQGLTVALLEKSDENLADTGRASDAVAYLPPNLSPAQHAALLIWARKNTAAQLDDTRIKISPLAVAFSGQQIQFSAGTKMTFTGAAPEPCTTGACGQMLWYQPRVAASSFAVDELGESRIVEPLLSLRWMDHNRNTLFVGRFGDREITIPGLCGAPTASL